MIRKLRKNKAIREILGKIRKIKVNLGKLRYWLGKVKEG